MNNKKYKRVITTCIIIILILLIALLLLIFQQPSDKISKDCPYLKPNTYIVDSSLIECFGVISIGLVFQDQFEIRDDKNDYTIAIIDNRDKIKKVNNNLFIYYPIKHFFSKEEKLQPYYKDFFVQGESKHFKFTFDEVSEYIQVEISTGEITLYNTYKQMPDDVKSIFQDLENQKISE